MKPVMWKQSDFPPDSVMEEIANLTCEGGSFPACSKAQCRWCNSCAMIVFEGYAGLELALKNVAFPFSTPLWKAKWSLQFPLSLRGQRTKAGRCLFSLMECIIWSGGHRRIIRNTGMVIFTCPIITICPHCVNLSSLTHLTSPLLAPLASK